RYEKHASCNHRSCVNQRADGRWAFHGVRQPNMQRHLARLANRAAKDQKSYSCRNCHANASGLCDEADECRMFKAAGAAVVKEQRAGLRIKPDHAEQESEVANA